MQNDIAERKNNWGDQEICRIILLKDRRIKEIKRYAEL